MLRFDMRGGAGIVAGLLLSLMFGFPGIAQEAPRPPAGEAALASPLARSLAVVEAEARALLVVRDAVAGSHTGDIRDFEAQFHFPHYRFASGNVTVFERPGLQPSNLMSTMEGGRWRYSVLDSAEIVQSDETKVHVAVRYSRYGEQDQLLATYDSLWIITFENGRWAIKARSSFAP